MFPINIFLNKCAFGFKLKSQLILLFSLFLQLFMSPTALFGTIHGSHCTISTNFYLYLQYFQQKVFSFSKINGSQISPISSQFINIDMTTFIEEKQTRMRKHDIKNLPYSMNKNTLYIPKGSSPLLLTILQDHQQLL